ncbi:MAG: hypothetical protein KGR26_03450 [Cyanobacteria bacterium REEB65]|nr:hypothetical protein [Cyanobacteria bacterium REEB65]
MLTGALVAATSSVMALAPASLPFAPASLRPPALQEREAIISHSQLQLHQGFALATLGLMAADSALGLYDVYFTSPRYLLPLHTVHVALGGATAALYLGAATLALAAPQGYDPGAEPGWDSVTVHESLAWLHGTALAATVVLGGLTAVGALNPAYHGLAAGATLALMATSAGVIVFDF